MARAPRTVVLTGASAGVGRASARAFGARGDRVGLIARPGPGLDEAAREVGAAGGRALVLPGDVADFAQVDAAAAHAEDVLGPIDVWVNDAMATIFAFTWDIRPDEIRRATEVTYLGAVHGTLAALSRMRARDAGTIVQVGSALAYRAIPLQAAYCAAKHALRGFTDSLRVELLHEGSNVHVTMPHMPGLNTPQFTWVRVRGLGKRPQPVPPVYQPEIAADAVVWASEHPRREYLVGGSTLMTVLGNRVAPRVADRYLARSNVQAQQSDTSLSEDHEDYLFSAIEEDRGAHGPYDDQAKGRSWQWEASKRLPLLLAGAGGLAAASLMRR